MNRPRAVTVVVAGIALVAATACVERVERVEQAPTESDTVDGAGDTSGLRPDILGGELADGPPVVTRFPGMEFSFGTLPDEPIEADGDPIVLGMINQEETPLGSFPEVRLGAQAAVDFINAELGGVDGRPLELRPCITSFDPQQSQSCAQDLVQRGAVAVLGGLDITSNGSIPVLERNEVPYIGGIPINLDEMTSPISFQFSGGSPGAFAAFAHHAAAQGAERVVVAYGEFPPIELAAVEFGVGVLESLGVDAIAVPFPITTTDFLPVMTRAGEFEPDAVFIGAADTACVPAMQTAHDLDIDADLYFVGACAAPGILDQAGDAAEGRIFGIEGPLEDGTPDGDLYMAVIGTHGQNGVPAASAATVSFRAVMNLYAVLDDIGADDITSDSIIEAFRTTSGSPSFDGHPYTCDGQQIPQLPSLCSPQQVLGIFEDGELVELSSWIDVPSVVADAGIGTEPPSGR
ncbi:MAG: ABC transporter substrate-binding protein [Acidimicrobiia bacterium]|nr:ABC transporter substrate-binding protein [Acidimicrobiia bacterium]